jgi:hypothetical protein
MRIVVLLIKNPLTWLAVFLVVFSFYHLNNNFKNKSIIDSDGSGYYAFLPAFFIYQDHTFEKTAEVERIKRGSNTYQHYLIYDSDGKQYNKYFPGVALLQAPFFGLACFTSWVFQQPIDGYSTIFVFFFLLGSLFYVFVSVYFLKKVLLILFPEFKKYITLVLIGFVLSTSLLFYMFQVPSQSHLYSFAFFTVFYYLILRIKEDFTPKLLFLLVIVLAIICVLRPTNITIVFTIPFFLENKENSIYFLKKLFAKRAKHLLISILIFFSILSVVFLSWKWQTNTWMKGSYSGEGFTFLKPYIFQSLFSFRIGLFLHSPLYLISCIAAIFYVFKKFFQFSWWFLYFCLNVWIISSWWCWDYESPFGARPYVEHSLFLLIPFFYFLRDVKKWAIPLFVLFFLIGSLRYLSFVTGSMTDQRFTKENYLESLFFWTEKNKGRWNWTRATLPFGTVIKDSILIDKKEIQKIQSEDEFSNTIEFTYPTNRGKKRFYTFVT